MMNEAEDSIETLHKEKLAQRRVIKLITGGLIVFLLFGAYGFLAMAHQNSVINHLAEALTAQRDQFEQCKDEEATGNCKNPVSPDPGDIVGQAGPIGPIGPAGPAGEQGERGPQGPQGIQGVQGIPGVQGTVGVDGKSGPTGSTGPSGPMGPQGETGPPGPTGPQGETGPAGPPGTNGQNGPMGVEGRGIVDVECTSSGVFLFTFTDGTTDTAGACIPLS